MDTIEINAPSIQQHNAQFSREAEIVREIDRILRLHLFPFERVWVDVRFDYGMSDHSASKVELMRINGEMHGTVEIRLQGLFLWQDFPTFISEVVPHELAHVFLEVDCAERGVTQDKPHDDSWVEKVLEINPDAEPVAKVKGEFDERPIKLKRGAIGCACECGDDEGFAVFPNTPGSVVKLQNEELNCTHCNSAYSRLKPEEWPEAIKTAIQFYERIEEAKFHNPPLTR